MATRNRNVSERTRQVSGHDGEPGSPGRRAFMVFAGASAGATLLGTLPGCGGSVDAAPGALDPIWGTVGLATQIINSLQGITQSIRARVARFGGSAVVRSAPGEGAEVQLSMPRRERVK